MFGVARKRLTSCLLLALFVLIGHTRPARAQDVSAITAPATGATVSGDVAILGTAVIEPFQKYELHYKQEPSSNDAYIYFGGNTVPVTNGQLGIWQAGGLPPGTYSLRLRVVKADGNYAEYFAQNLSVNQGPAATPTSSEPTITPTPTATYTPAPQPTVALGAVEQPQVEGDAVIQPTPTPIAVAAVDLGATATPASDGLSLQSTTVTTGTGAGVDAAESGGVTLALGEALAFDTLRDRFWAGVRYSAALCLGVLAIFGGKRLFDWVWTQFR